MRGNRLRGVVGLGTVLGAAALVTAVFAGHAGAAFSACSGNKAATTLVVTSSTPTTAGDPYPVTVEAVNTKFACRATTYTGTVTLTGFDSSETSPAPYTYTSGDAGVHTFNVVLTKAATGRALTAGDNSSPRLVASQTGITVLPGPLSQLTFSKSGFNGQPVATKTATPIYSFCAASGVLATPCKTIAGGSGGVAVLAIDQWGNARPGDAVGLKYQTVSQQVGSATDFVPVASQTTDTNGIAFFGDNLTIGSPGTYQLQASSGAVIGTSTTFQVVADLVACTTASCVTKATASSGRHIAYGKVVAGQSTFQTTLVTNQFAASAIGNCAASATYVRATDFDTEIRPISQIPTVDPLTQTKPSTTVALIVPNAVLQDGGFTNRAINTWNVCVGAQWIGLPPTPTSGWLAKTGPFATTLLPTSLGAGDYFWGWAPDCSALTAAQRATGNPCISLRTKNSSELGAALGLNATQVAALPFKSSDLAVVVTMSFGWDGQYAGP